MYLGKINETQKQNNENNNKNKTFCTKMEASAPLGMRAKGAGTGGRQGALPVHRLPRAGWGCPGLQALLG